MVLVRLCHNDNVALHQIARQTRYNRSFQRWVKRRSIRSRLIGFPWQHTGPLPNGSTRKASQSIFSRTDIRNTKFGPSFQSTVLRSIDCIMSWRTASTRYILNIPFTFLLMQSTHDSNLDVIKANAETWEVEDGFLCTHRRLKQYLFYATLTFTKLHQRYKAKIKASNDGACVVSYSRWIQYVHLFYLGLHLAHLVEDVCDCYVWIDI